MSRSALERRDVLVETVAGPEEPEIRQTSPPRTRKDYGIIRKEGDDLHRPPTLGHQEMEVEVKINPVPKCLNGRDDSRHKLAPGCHLEITGQGPEGAATKISQEPAIVLEEYPQHLGDDKDDLTVRNIQEERLPHPLAPLLQPLRMT